MLPRSQTSPCPHPLLPRSCLLQADSERLLQLWVSAVQSSIATAFSQALLDDSSRGPGQVPEHGGQAQVAQGDGASRPLDPLATLSSPVSSRAQDTWPWAPLPPWALVG